MSRRILVAGIGNIFLADDGFGVEVARRLAQRPLPEGVEVIDFGIRGMDLAYALLEDFDAIIFVDALPRGEQAGTVYLMEPELDGVSDVTIDAHGMDPVKVLAFARGLGARPTRTYVVGCEPEVVGGDDFEDVVVGLSASVQVAVDEAVIMVESLLKDLIGEPVPAHVAE